MSDKIREKVKEIFTSVQGEGPYLGVKQVFVRFCGCNLACKYCDTDTNPQDAALYTPQELAEKINREKNIHSVAITGGEPLLHSKFLKLLFPLLNAPVYLETNATLTDELSQVIDLVQIVSADIKLPSSAGADTFNLHEKFLKLCCDKDKDVFAKVVFDDKITDEEISRTVNIARKLGLLIVLQPMMIGDMPAASSEFNEQIFNKFTDLYGNVRMIPQTHKFLGLK